MTKIFELSPEHFRYPPRSQGLSRLFRYFVQPIRTFYAPSRGNGLTELFCAILQELSKSVRRRWHFTSKIFASRRQNATFVLCNSGNIYFFSLRKNFSRFNNSFFFFARCLDVRGSLRKTKCSFSTKAF